MHIISEKKKNIYNTMLPRSFTGIFRKYDILNQMNKSIYPNPTIQPYTCR